MRLPQRVVLVVLVGACSQASAGRLESKATLVGRLQFPGGAPDADRGSVKLIVNARGELDDSCERSHHGTFVATYDGELALGTDNSFEATLYPSSMATPDGCAVNHVRVELVSSITIAAKVADRTGRGALTFQNLAAVDDRDLRTGAFGELVAEIVFDPPASND